jgi:hypothetical protein
MVLLPQTIIRGERNVYFKYEENKNVWEELIAYFPLILHGPYRKGHLQQFFVATGASLTSFYVAMIGGHTVRPTYSPLIRHRPYRRQRVQQLFNCWVCSLPRERVYGAVALERYEGIYTDRWEGFIKYAFEMS